MLACASTLEGRLCLRSCSGIRLGEEISGDERYRRFTCEDDAVIHCDLADLEQCLRCGCGPTEFCDRRTEACRPLSDVGEFCQFDADCRSNNCSTFGNVCRVPVGDECTWGDCDLCLDGLDGRSFCSRECDSCERGICRQSRIHGFPLCMPPCDRRFDGRCPGECIEGPRSGTFACDAEIDFEANREDGVPCRADETCVSGDCYARAQCPRSCQVRVGWCAVEGCRGGCAAGTECVDVPCAHPDMECGTRCLPVCETDDDCLRTTEADRDGDEFGFCRELRSLERVGGVRVCDVHLPVDAFCFSGSQCQSGECVADRCVSGEGLPNGEACDEDDDCESGECFDGFCRGDALLGDACESDADCRVGRCCPRSGEDRTCQPSC